MNCATEFLFLLAVLVVLLIWTPVVVWISVQSGVYAFFFARRNFHRRYSQESGHGNR